MNCKFRSAHLISYWKMAFLFWRNFRNIFYKTEQQFGMLENIPTAFLRVNDTKQLHQKLYVLCSSTVVALISVRQSTKLQQHMLFHSIYSQVADFHWIVVSNTLPLILNFLIWNRCASSLGTLLGLENGVDDLQFQDYTYKYYCLRMLVVL